MIDDLNWEMDGMPNGLRTDANEPEEKRSRLFENIISLADLSNDEIQRALGPSLSPADEGVKHDTGKTDWSLLPLDATEKVVEVLTHGAEKYSRDNWKEVPGAENRYFAAAMRHIVAHRRGEHLDPESGLPHLAHAICCLMFLLERE